MNIRTLLLTLLFLALLPTAASAQKGRTGIYDARGSVYNNRCYSRPAYNYNRCYSRPAYYSAPVFFNTGYFGNYGYPFGYGNYGYGNYNYGYSRPSYGGNPMTLPKWTTSQKQLEKVEVEEGKPELEVPEIK